MQYLFWTLFWWGGKAGGRNAGCRTGKDFFFSLFRSVLKTVRLAADLFTHFWPPEVPRQRRGGCGIIALRGGGGAKRGRMRGRPNVGPASYVEVNAVDTGFELGWACWERGVGRCVISFTYSGGTGRREVGVGQGRAERQPLVRYFFFRWCDGSRFSRQGFGRVEREAHFFFFVMVSDQKVKILGVKTQVYSHDLTDGTSLILLLSSFFPLMLCFRLRVSDPLRWQAEFESGGSRPPATTALDDPQEGDSWEDYGTRRSRDKENVYDATRLVIGYRKISGVGVGNIGYRIIFVGYWSDMDGIVSFC